MRLSCSPFSAGECSMIKLGFEIECEFMLGGLFSWKYTILAVLPAAAKAPSPKCLPSNLALFITNLMRRDFLFAAEILEQAKSFEYTSLVVDGKSSISENYDIVASTFGLRGNIL